MRQAAAGRTGQARAAWVPMAHPLQPRPWPAPERQARWQELPSRKCMRIFGTPRVSSWNPGGSPLSSRPPACWGLGRARRGLWSQA